ncbi:MAG: mechanosensitive ion channel family protein [Nitrospirae bacterium]|nr:mechanosensitive ion channel family protein [Nitrospirota bacterium]MDA1303099.1 mechanosensitive ion channel family protein [Nitrospirota bacterium]
MLGTDVSMDLLVQYGVQATSALLILAAGFLFAHWTGKYTHKALARFDMEPPVRLLLVRVTKGIVILMTLLVVLQQFGVQIFPLIAGLGVAGVGIGLALQGVFFNLFAGLSIIFTKPFRVGQYIELLGVYGEVQAIDIFTTKLKHLDQSDIIIPNRLIIGEILHNYGKIRQLDLSVGVAYATDLNKALATVRQVVTDNTRTLQEPAPVIGITQLADSSINICVKPWVNIPDYVDSQAELYEAIVEQFRINDIQIPFPQREIRMMNAS